jgi:hypothetical protein
MQTMQQSMTVGATSKSIFIFLSDPEDGLGKTGLAFDTVGLLASFAKTKAARVAITLATLATISTAWSSGGFKEVDATNMPGWYRLDVPNAAFSTSVTQVVISIFTATTVYGSVLVQMGSVSGSVASGGTVRTDN